MRIKLKYRVEVLKGYPQEDRYEKVEIEVPENADISTLISQVPAEGLSQRLMSNRGPKYSDEVLKEGRFEEGKEYLLRGYNLNNIKKRIKEGFKF